MRHGYERMPSVLWLHSRSVHVRCRGGVQPDGHADVYRLRCGHHLCLANELWRQLLLFHQSKQPRAVVRTEHCLRDGYGLYQRCPVSRGLGLYGQYVLRCGGHLRTGLCYGSRSSQKLPSGNINQLRTGLGRMRGRCSGVNPRAPSLTCIPTRR
jgi:hypothetical protein